MNKKTIRLGFYLLSIIAAAILAMILFSKPVAFRGTSYGEPYPAAAPIELQKADGSTFYLQDLKGKIVLLFFGYTSCPDVCPTTLAELNVALTEMKSDAENIQVVFISVDPERDTPQSTQEYVTRFNQNFLGLSGTFAELQPVWEAYGIFREKKLSDSALDYLVDHTARVNLIDADGNLRLSYSFDTPVEDMVHDLKLILK